MPRSFVRKGAVVGVVFAGLRHLAVRTSSLVNCNRNTIRLALACAAAVLLGRTAHVYGEPAHNAPPAAAQIAERLMAAYPGIVTSVAADAVVLADGTRLPLDDGRGDKAFAAWLADPDIEDMFRLPYPAGAPATAPPRDFDPGRARNAAFFAAVYGDCTKGGVAKNLVEVVWLPKKSGATLKVSRINGVADKLRAVSAELDELPSRFDSYLVPAAGTYNCRPIAGTNQQSAHGYGIAVDIAVGPSHYWRWAVGGAAAPIAYKNAIPLEIVSIFEKHGFIWGGRWHHYDTMHFEYRPELLTARAAAP